MFSPTRFYTIERSGSLNAVDPFKGSWNRVGTESWTDTIQAHGMGDSLYTIERSGALYRTGTNGQWIKLGASEFARSKFLIGIDGRLYTIEKNGSLYSVLVE